MGNFDSIKEALLFIDENLTQPISIEAVAGHFHFSTYYFHRMFSLIVGKTMSVHIRDRRLMQACVRLAGSDNTILSIALDCGYNSAQAFSRVFKNVYGLSPSQYRRNGFFPTITTVDEMIMKFTNRLKGGILVNPKIIKKDALHILGVSGDGNKTWEVWNTFETKKGEHPIPDKLSDNGYEIRLYENDTSTVHVGLAVLEGTAALNYTCVHLPASKYACFDVYVAQGYDSENNAMNQWLETNEEGYVERLLENGAHYCVEYYDGRFSGEEAGSIVEIWIPIESK